MPLPASLSVDALKRRIDKQLPQDDELLSEFLESAFEQAQAPAPLGCGRLLRPDPPIAEDGSDAAEPATREIVVRGRHVLVPDARELAKVEHDGVELDAAGYRMLVRDGMVVRLTLPYEHTRWFRRRWPYAEAHHESVVKLTGRFGFAEVPEPLCEAIYLLAARAYYERAAQFADTVAVGEGAAAQVYYRNMPARTRLAFESFALPSAVAGLA